MKRVDILAKVQGKHLTIYLDGQLTNILVTCLCPTLPVKFQFFSVFW